MKHRGIGLLGLVICAVLVVGCAPTVSVLNKTGIGVRAIVASGGTRQVLSPSPGESSAAEVVEGPFTVAVIPDTDWIEYAKIKRKLLNEQLANADKLTGAQLLEVIRQLKDVAEKMSQFEATAAKGASCSGAITQEGGSGIAEISVGPNGALVVACK